jgi:serine/threonine-protein kinase
MTELAALAPDWPQISRVLDDALALPAGERASWLAGQTALTEPVRQVVQRLLAVQADIETGDFLGTLPPLGMRRGAEPGPGVGAGAAWGEPEPGAVVGPWRLLRELGQGGMGSVWLAERADGSLKRQVALKLPRLSWARGLAERMARERDILASLEHPHIARLYDAGVDEHGRPWLALEHVQGQPIDEHARDKALDVKQRVRLLLQVCEAVAYAHSRLVIHRDLKPGNILVTADGQVKLLDFGIAKLMQGEQAQATALTELGGRLLTLDYASPEQVRGEALTTSSDVYSLGVVAFELLTGARPYQLKRGSAAELEEAIATLEPPLASASATEPAARAALRGDLDAIVNRALKKDAAQRYVTVDALAQDLRHQRQGLPVAARPDSWVHRVRRVVRRHRVAVGLLGALALALLGGAYAQAAVMVALAAGVLAALWQRQEAVRQAERAQAEAAAARVQSRRAEKVKAFALGLFDQANLLGSGSAETTVVDMLRRAHVDLDDSADGDAATALELRIALARAMLGFGGAQDALRVLDAVQARSLAPAGTKHALRAELTLARADALAQAGRTDEALALLEPLPEQADAEHRSRALQQRSNGRYRLGRYDEALVDARAAVAAAEAGASPGVLLAALNEQTRLMGHLFLGDRLASARRAVEVATHADPRRDAVQILMAHELMAAAECFEGDARRGLQAYGEIVARLEQRLGPQHDRVAAALNTQATAQYQCGDSAGALKSLRRCMDIERAAHGEHTQHMRIGRAGVGAIHVNEGRHAQGIALLRQALQEKRAAEGEDHPLTATGRQRLVSNLIKSGELDEARALLDEIAARGFANVPARDQWEQDQGSWLAAVGRVEEALAQMEPAQLRRLQAPMLHTRGVAAHTLGALLVDAGQPERGLALLEQALQVFGSRHPFGSAALARTRTACCRAHLALGNAAAALAEAREAVSYWQRDDPGVPPAAEAHGWLALALAEQGQMEAARQAAQRAEAAVAAPRVHLARVLHLALAQRGLLARQPAA